MKPGRKAAEGTAYGLFRSQSFDTNANIGEHQNATASFATTKLTVPSTFLSLHYAGTVSSNMFFTANLSETRRTP